MQRNLQFSDIAVGDIITYYLPAAKAHHPEKQYLGTVTRIYFRSQVVEVTVLTEGYEGLSEPVALTEIIAVEKPSQERD